MASFLEDVISGHENAMYGETGTSGLYHNSPTQTNYNVNATSDLANRISQGVGSIPMAGPYLQGATDLAMPALALGASPFYDTGQAIAKAKDKYGSSYGMVDDTEIPGGPTMGQFGTELNNQNILSSMFERSLGAATPLASKLSFNAPNFNLMGSAQASELTDVERDFPGMSTGDIIDSMNNRGPVATNIATAPQPKGMSYEQMVDLGLAGPDQDVGMTAEDLQNRPSFFGNIQNKIGSGLGSLKDFATNKGTQGFNLGKMALSGIGNAIMPGLGFVLSNLKGEPLFSETLANSRMANPLGTRGVGPDGVKLDGVSDFGGFTTDDLGRVVQTGKYTDLGLAGKVLSPEDIMTGYNAGFDLAGSALGRIGKIKNSIAKGKFKDKFAVDRANQRINNLKTAAVASAQSKRQAYQDKIDRAKNEAAANRARTKSITAGYGGGNDNDRPSTGPTSVGAGMGVGGGYASDYGFLKDGGSVGLASMFTRRR